MTAEAQTSRRGPLTRRLEAYSRNARSQGNSHRHVVQAGYGTLAALVPLAASVGDADAQVVNCETISPASVLALLFNTTGFNSDTALFSFGGGAQGRIRMVGNTGQNTLFLSRYAGNWDVAATGSAGYAVARDTSGTFALTSLASVAKLCRAFGSSLTGPFCPPNGTRYQAVGSIGGPGFIELEVVSMLNGQAGVRIGQYQYGSSPAHAGDCQALSLPVELSSFTGVSDRGTPVLKWETASEVNNAGFEVERASADDLFRKLAYVDGMGTTTDPQSYTFADETAQPNVLYRYRLKQVDLDGTTSFSPIVEVFAEAPGLVSVGDVYPNPASGQGARLDINVAEARDATIEVYDIRGALVRTESRILNQGQNRISLDTHEQANGPHFVKIQIGTEVVYRPFVIAE